MSKVISFSLNGEIARILFKTLDRYMTEIIFVVNKDGLLIADYDTSKSARLIFTAKPYNLAPCILPKGKDEEIFILSSNELKKLTKNLTIDNIVGFSISSNFIYGDIVEMTIDSENVIEEYKMKGKTEDYKRKKLQFGFTNYIALNLQTFRNVLKRAALISHQTQFVLEKNHNFSFFTESDYGTLTSQFIDELGIFGVRASEDKEYRSMYSIKLLLPFFMDIPKKTKYSEIGLEFDTNKPCMITYSMDQDIRFSLVIAPRIKRG